MKVKYSVLIRKNSTGEERVIDTDWLWDLESPSTHWWKEGNFSCDCNRSEVFGDGEPDHCSDGRYTVIDAKLSNGDIIKIDD